MGHASLPNELPTSEAFAQAHAEYVRLRAIEDGVEPATSFEQEEAAEAALRRACRATDAAFAKMAAIPTSNPAQVAAKVRAAALQYDLGSCGMDRAVMAQLLAEIDNALTQGAHA